MDDAGRADDGYAIPVAALNRPGGPRRSIAAGLAIVVVLAMVGVGTRLMAAPEPIPSGAAESTGVAAIPTPTPARTLSLPSAIELDERPIQPGSAVGEMFCAGDATGEVAGVEDGRPFIRNLDFGALQFINLPAGFDASQCNWTLSDHTLVGTIYRPPAPETPDSLLTNLAFVYDRVSSTGRRSRPLDGFEAFTIRGVASLVAFGEVEHSVPCCIAGGSQIVETRAVTIDLASGAVTDITPEIWRSRGLAVSVRAADGERLLLSAETAVSAEDASGIPVFVGAAVIDLSTGATTMLRLGRDAGAVTGMVQDHVVGQYADPVGRAFVIEIGSSEERAVPTSDGATLSRCAFAIPELMLFACGEGVPFFRTGAFTFDPTTNARTDLPITILAGQELDLTAAGTDGVLAGMVTRDSSIADAFAYDARTQALYRLRTPADAVAVPEVIAGRWVLSVDSLHAWRLP
jgi:hypothetical protein